MVSTAAPDRYGANAPPLIPLEDGASASHPAANTPPAGSRPKGILKNASSGAVQIVSSGGSGSFATVGGSFGEAPEASMVTSDDAVGEPERGLTWDEENLARTEAEKDSQMKITEPKTPFVQYDALNDMVLSEVPGFDLGTLNGQSTADVLASPSNGPSPPSSHPSMPSSRSTSFSLPASEHPASSLTADAAGSPTGGTKTVAAGEVEEDEEEMTPEQEAKHREFVKARGRHYSNEGEAMRRSKELLEKELAEDDDDDDNEEDAAMDGVEDSAIAPARNGLRLDGL